MNDSNDLSETVDAKLDDHAPMSRPRWLLDLHPDFPGSAVVAARLSDAIIIDARDALMGRWPKVAPPVVGYGTMRTMTRLLREPGLRDAVFDDYPKLRCSAYYPHVYDRLGRTCVLVPFCALPQLPLERMFGASVFVRPDTNYKLFPASVLSVREVARWLDLYVEHRDELVVVSEVVTFDREYRCFVRDARVVCGSSYPEVPWVGVPEHVQRFAEEIARRILVTGVNMITVDVGVTGDTLRLVELGGVNSWGIYGSNVDDFIAVMEAEAVARAALTAATLPG